MLIAKAAHVGVVISGAVMVKHEDGTTGTYSAGDAYAVSPGHDAWGDLDSPAGSVPGKLDVRSSVRGENDRTRFRHVPQQLVDRPKDFLCLGWSWIGRLGTSSRDALGRASTA